MKIGHPTCEVLSGPKARVKALAGGRSLPQAGLRFTQQGRWGAGGEYGAIATLEEPDPGCRCRLTGTRPNSGVGSQEWGHLVLAE